MEPAPGAAEKPPAALFVIRYSEIGLKGENRGWFEDVLVRNIRSRLQPICKPRIDKRRGRIVVRVDGGDPALARAVADRLADTPGIRSFSPAKAVKPEFAALEAAAVACARAVVAAARPAPATFRVETRRGDKQFPKTSIEVDAAIGSSILDAIPGLKVKLVDPDLTVGVEIQHGEAYVMSDWRDGPGGLPVGSSGPVALLLSGGIDSPVAGMLLQNRGCTVLPVYCHAFPFTGDAAREKVRDLARELARRQTSLELRIAEIAEAQTQLRDKCRADRLVVLYRRLMVRIVERVAERQGVNALGTGENIGQVASQTLPNMRAIDAAATRPILRPLATNHKEETIRLAKRLGTYEISVRPADDCCQLFVPKHPATRVTVEEALEEEAKVDVAGMVEACVAKMETVKFLNGEVVVRGGAA